jgi:hypothetical protein
MKGGPAFPVEDFVQALIHQLDNVQDALALKVRAGRPLTWALKDLRLDLQVFVEVDEHGVVRMRSAGPDESGASTFHVNLSTITRPMVEENTYAFEEDVDPRSLTELGPALNDEQRRRLEWMGVKTVGQLKKLSDPASQQAVQAHSGIPAGDLMRALEASARPTVTGHRIGRASDGRPVVHIQGANLYDGVNPEVRLCGEPVEVLEARPQELVVRPGAHHHEGQVEVLVKGERCTGWFRRDDASRPDPWASPLDGGER